MGNLYICPHYREIDEKYFNKAFTKASAIRGEDENLFYFTHYPIYLYDHHESEKKYHESEVLDELLKPNRVGNFTLAIEGETGTGKSELCIYLDHELRKRGYPVLRIDKNSDLMKILAEDIPNFYRKITGKEIKGEKELKELQREIKYNPGILAHKIGFQAISILLKKYPNLKDINPNNKKIKQFNRFLKNQLNQLINRKGNGKYPSEIKFITEQDLKTGSRDFNFGIPGTPTEIAENFNEAIWKAIKKNEEIPSMDILLEEINKEIEKRWCIVFEDFSISSLDQKELQRFIERDNEKDHINFIIAGLEDKLQILHTPTAEDRTSERISFYKTSKTGESNVLFLNEENCVEFIKPYICFFKTKDGSLNYRKNKEGVIQELIYGEEKNLCNSCDKCPRIKRDIFPFNEIFLKRVYKGLTKEEQKPRRYVEVIGIILEEYFNHHIIPSSSTILNDLYNSFNLLKSIYEMNDERLNNFIRWYSMEEDNLIKFSESYASLLGISLEKIKSSYHLDGNIIISKTGKKEITETTEIKETENTGEIIPRWKKKFEELKGNVKNWRRNPYGEKWYELHDYLTNIISSLYENFSDEYMIRNNFPISIRVGKNENIFTFNEINFSDKGEFKNFQFSIKSEDFNEFEIIQLLKSSIIKEFNKSEFKISNLIKRTPYPIVNGFIKWRKQCEEYLHNFNYYKYSSTEKYNLIEIPFVYSFLAFVIQKPWSEFDDNTVFIEFLNDEDNKTPKYLKKNLSHKKDLKEKFSQFFKNLVFSNMLLIGFLKIKNTNRINYDKFRKKLGYKENHLFKILDSLKKTSMDDYPKNRIKINVDKSDIKFEDFFGQLYTLGRFLIDSDIFFEIKEEEIREDLKSLKELTRNIEFDKIEYLKKKLETYNSVDRDLIVSLNDLIKEEKNFEDFKSGLNFLDVKMNELRSQRYQNKIQYLNFRISLAYHKLNDFHNIKKLIGKIQESIKVESGHISNLHKILDLRGYLN